MGSYVVRRQWRACVTRPQVIQGDTDTRNRVPWLDVRGEKLFLVEPCQIVLPFLVFHHSPSTLGIQKMILEKFKWSMDQFSRNRAFGQIWMLLANLFLHYPQCKMPDASQLFMRMFMFDTLFQEFTKLLNKLWKMPGGMISSPEINLLPHW